MANVKMIKGNASRGSVEAAKVLNKRAKQAEKDIAEDMIIIRRRKREPMDEKEKTPARRFYRLANIRTQRIVLLLHSLKACLNPDSFESTLKQRKHVYALVKGAYVDWREAWVASLESETIEKENKAIVKNRKPNIFSGI